jgi:hypothetical protein
MAQTGKTGPGYFSEVIAMKTHGFCRSLLFAVALVGVVACQQEATKNGVPKAPSASGNPATDTAGQADRGQHQDAAGQGPFGGGHAGKGRGQDRRHGQGRDAIAENISPDTETQDNLVSIVKETGYTILCDS